MVPYADILAFVQPIAPTWCKTQHITFAQRVCVADRPARRGVAAITDVPTLPGFRDRAVVVDVCSAARASAGRWRTISDARWGCVLGR